jgi:hypothetical protein
MTMQDPQQPQVAGPRVGDTVTVVQRVLAPGAAVVQPRGPSDTAIATLWRAPVIAREGDSVRIATTLTMWAPGRSTIVLPGAIVVHPDGRVDTMPDARITIEVASVLPTGRPVAQVAPRDARAWVPRGERTALPFLLLGPVLLGALVAIWWARRRGPLPGAPAAAPRAEATHDQLRRWLAAGEAGIVVTHLRAQLPDDAETAAWWDAVEAVRFLPDGEARLAALATRGLARLPESAR